MRAAPAVAPPAARVGGTGWPGGALRHHAARPGRPVPGGPRAWTAAPGPRASGERGAPLTRPGGVEAADRAQGGARPRGARAGPMPRADAAGTPTPRPGGVLGGPPVPAGG